MCRVELRKVNVFSSHLSKDQGNDEALDSGCIHHSPCCHSFDFCSSDSPRIRGIPDEQKLSEQGTRASSNVIALPSMVVWNFQAQGIGMGRAKSGYANMVEKAKGDGSGSECAFVSKDKWNYQL